MQAGIVGIQASPTQACGGFGGGDVGGGGVDVGRGVGSEGDVGSGGVGGGEGYNGYHPGATNHPNLVCKLVGVDVGRSGRVGGWGPLPSELVVVLRYWYMEGVAAAQSYQTQHHGHHHQELLSPNPSMHTLCLLTLSDAPRNDGFIATSS
ncbi:hypothetical protein Pmani_004428 [Petrolisthes manimaculis]|uniref:Uncharacterized protein n=1 Tax=Petrolisthes manimaculis TaxID=1843537 RepID=A0AAE1QEY4_9EUCA|nr:hypothetical protein Pmani_004428 [Petrolisthes manimaculis]